MVIKEEFLPTRISKERCVILIFLMLSMYTLENSQVTIIIDNFTFNYILKPILWSGLAFIVWTFPHIRAKGRLKLRSFTNFWALNFAIIYIIISVLAGIVDALGKSPYNHSPMGILTNVAFVGSVLVGREFIRSYLVNSFTNEENHLVFIIIALMMTFTSISFKKYIEIGEYVDLVKLIAQYIAPEFAQNLFAVYLVYLGGPLTSIIYLGTIQGFHWLSPILPDLKWITTGLIGVLCPTFFMMSLQGIYLNASKQLKIKDKDEESPVSWMITSIISIAIIWFAVGVFPVYPSVIATGSMEPDIKPGDVILIEKIVDMEGINKLKVDDVIQFKRDSILVSHRIIDIKNDEKLGVNFKTKGDNNTGPDIELVKPEDVKGVIVYIVPKIGWPTLIIKSDKDIPLDNIVF